MAEYFSNFPLTVYQNTVCVDITRRVVMRDATLGDTKAFHPYEVPAGDRADQIAHHYYGSVDDTWLVYASAGVLDPYHGWYRDEYDFNEHVGVKYGSYEEAVERVHHWQLNWYGTDAELTVAGYDALSAPLKKYYEPVYGQGSEVLSYQRRDEDWVASTNMVLRLEIENQGNVVVSGERVKIKTGATLTGQAEVAWANSTVIKLIHVSGNTDPGNLVVGVTSGANAVISAREFTSNTIPIEERPFWTPVSMYDFERDRNESLKNIKLVDRKYQLAFNDELRRLLND